MVVAVIVLSVIVVGLVLVVVPAAYVAGIREGGRRSRWIGRSRSAGHTFRPLAPGETPARRPA